jgi:hypothetical protein
MQLISILYDNYSKYFTNTSTRGLKGSDYVKWIMLMGKVIKVS